MPYKDPEELRRNKKRYHEENGDKIRAYKREQYHKDPDKSRADQKKRRDNSPETMILYNARSRGKRSGIEVTIALGDIVIPEFCPVLGYRLERKDGVKNHFSPSLDRIDPTQGYIPGNVQVISDRANRMKNDASMEDLIAFAEWVQLTYKEEKE